MCIRVLSHRVVHLKYIQLKKIKNKMIWHTEKKRHRLGHIHEGTVQGEGHEDVSVCCVYEEESISELGRSAAG